MSGSFYRRRLLMLFSGVCAVLMLLCSALPALAAPANGMELFVAPQGSDAAAGSFAAPLRTVEAALARIKTQRSSAEMSAVIRLRAGRYPVNRALSFTDPALANITLVAYGGEQVEITASVPLTGFAPCEINGVSAFSLQTDLRFHALYHPSQVIQTPRWPETGHFTVKRVEHADELFPGNQGWWEASNGCTAFYADSSRIGLSFSQPEEVYCRVTHAWLDEIARIRFYESDSGKVGLGRPATYEVKPGDVFWFENVREALNAPGEWYLDEEAGMLYYVPFSGETPESLTLYAPVSAELLMIDGCGGLTFDHIRFSGTEWTLAVPPEDSGTRFEHNIDAYQASTDCDAALNVQNADGITFCNCEFVDIGNTALKFHKNTHDCVIQNCLFRRVGSTAIAVYGENVTPDAANADEAMSGFTIENNLIEAYGRNTYESTGVHLMYVKDSAVRHNEIHDGYYTGLSCGWIWGHEYQVTENVQITDNLIYDIGQGWLSDLGGMYLLGEQKGTVIARNVVYNVTRGHGANDYGGNGIYTDAGSSFFTIEQNLIYDCAANGLNIGGYNRDHIVRGNVVAFCKLSAFDPGWGDQEPDDHTCDCTGNIFYADNAPVILDVSADAAFTERGNLLWDRTNGEAVFGSDGYSGDYAQKLKIGAQYAKRNGFFKQDAVADPLFADPDARDFTLRPDSPALNGAIDFTPVDYRNAGLLPEASVGCGSLFERGAVFRASDLSAYENACSDPRFSYAAVMALNRVLPVLTLLMFLAAAILMLLAARGFPRVLLPVAALAAAAMLFPLNQVFAVNWNQNAYAVCLALFVAFTELPAFFAVKKLVPRILLIVLSVSASLGLTFLLNNVLGLGAGLALFAGAAVLAAFTLLYACLFFKHTESSASAVQ